MPDKTQYINYFNNPIPAKDVPSKYRSFPCEDPAQNCMPYELMDWKILNATTITDTISQITGMKITLEKDSNSTYLKDNKYYYGVYSKNQSDTIIFRTKNLMLVTEQNIITISHFNQNHHTDDTTYFLKVNDSVNVNKIRRIANDIHSQKMLIRIQDGDSVISINLKNQKNGYLSPNCFNEGDNRYHIICYLYTASDSIRFDYNFREELKYGFAFHLDKCCDNLRIILDWLYMYQLTNLALPNWEISKKFFNRNNLEDIIKWAN